MGTVERRSRSSISESSGMGGTPPKHRKPLATMYRGQSGPNGHRSCGGSAHFLFAHTRKPVHVWNCSSSRGSKCHHGCWTKDLRVSEYHGCGCSIVQFEASREAYESST